MIKDEIIQQLKLSTGEFVAFCTTIPDEDFFRQPLEKWSIAQNVKHLITSANMTKLAYTLPKFVIRLYTGKPNRLSRSYDELVDKYKLKLQRGGKASGRFVPEKIPTGKSKENWLKDFDSSANALVKKLTTWDDRQLDNYLAPHPLLGKITLRELGYFTIYHTHHHLNIIKERMKDYAPITT